MRTFIAAVVICAVGLAYWGMFNSPTAQHAQLYAQMSANPFRVADNPLASRVFVPMIAHILHVPWFAFTGIAAFLLVWLLVAQAGEFVALGFVFSGSSAAIFGYAGLIDGVMLACLIAALRFPKWWKEFLAVAGLVHPMALVLIPAFAFKAKRWDWLALLIPIPAIAMYLLYRPSLDVAFYAETTKTFTAIVLPSLFVALWSSLKLLWLIPLGWYSERKRGWEFFALVAFGCLALCFVAHDTTRALSLLVVGVAQVKSDSGVSLANLLIPTYYISTGSGMKFGGFLL